MKIKIKAIYCTDSNQLFAKRKNGQMDYFVGTHFIPENEYNNLEAVPEGEGYSDDHKKEKGKIKNISVSEFERIVEFHKDKYAKPEFFWQAIRAELFG